MKNLKSLILGLMVALLLIFYSSCTVDKADKTASFNIGWASGDITPDSPVLIWGQGPAVVSDGIIDPITVTALAMESGTGTTSEKIIMISCDLCAISDATRDGSPDNLRDNVRKLLKESLPELNSENIFLNATHTHTAPYCTSDPDSKSIYGIELDVMPPSACLKYISERIASAAKKSWNNRKPGGISYGLGHAVVGYNRRMTDMSGKSSGWGYNRPDFSHVEGYEDHAVNILYTWDKKRNLTGMIINLACTSQCTETISKISADFWHETRAEVRKRLGKNIFILPQCGAAGDQCPHVLIEGKAEERMQKLQFPGVETGIFKMARRKQVAMRIADAVTYVLPLVRDSIEWDPLFVHKMKTVNLTRRILTIEDYNDALTGAEESKKQYELKLLELKENPDIAKDPKWYIRGGGLAKISGLYSGIISQQRVMERFELQKTQPGIPIEVHVLRIDDIVIATNPFELYLDYGIRIKGRSPAIQTFVVQLAGFGSYLPSNRALAGGAYGATPRTNYVGPEGGQELVESTLELINSVWKNK